MSLAKEILAGPDNLPLLKVEGRFLHGPGDPLAQARAWAQTQVGRQAGVVAILGLGLGYHLLALRQGWPQARLIIHEPRIELAEIFHAQAPAEAKRLVTEGEVEMAGDLGEFKAALGQALVYGPAWITPALFILPGLEELAPQAVAEVRSALDLLNLRRASNHKTILSRWARVNANLAENYSTILGLPEAAAALGALAGRPAVVVAAGPSLAKNLQVLKEARDRVVVLAVGTVFKRLVAEGLIPDAVVLIEPEDHADQIAGQPELAAVILALSSVGHPAHFRPASRQTVVFHPQDWIARLSGDWPPTPDGGNVASAAFTLALTWGCDPIILVGQDLAYSHGQFYVHGAKSPGRKFDPDKLTKIRGSQEEWVYASSELVSYLSWYEESAAYLARTRPWLRLINATEGGAHVQGFCHQPLGQTVAALPPLQVPAGQELLAAWADFRRDPDLIRRRLAELRRETARLGELAAAEAVDLGVVTSELAQGPLASALAHLIGPSPRSPRLRRELRASLSASLADLGRLAQALQGQARAWTPG